MSLTSSCLIPDNAYYLTRSQVYSLNDFHRNIHYFTKIFTVRYFIGACLGIALFSQCSSSGTGTAKDSTAVFHPQTTLFVQGLYKGEFDGSPIYININYSRGKHVAGYNVHKGLRRNLSGSIQQAADGWELQLSEPGDHAFDGTFKLLFDANFATAKGQWTPLNTPSLKEKKFTISRAEEVNDHDGSDFAPGNTYAADHADISFDLDGSCVFNFYDKITDSTYAEQMTTVRGTWEKKDSGIVVNWQKNEHWDKATSSFTLAYQRTNEGSSYMTGIAGEGYEFSMPF